MCRLSNKGVFAFLIGLVAMLTTQPVHAGPNSPLSRAADCYREAVRDFDQLVQRTRYVDNHHERLVDDLKDSTSRLRSAARDSRRPDRTYARFAETRAYHFQVEGVFFTGRFYPINPELEACWAVVSEKYQDLAYLIQSLPRTGYGGGARPDYDRVYRSHGYSAPNQVSVPVPTFVPTDRYNPVSVYRNDAPATFRYGSNRPGAAIDYTRTRGYSSRTVNVGALLQRVER